MSLESDAEPAAGAVEPDAPEIPESHPYPAWVAGFFGLFIVFATLACLLLVPAIRLGRYNIGWLANAHIPVLTWLAQRFVNTAPTAPTRTGIELGLLLGFVAAALPTLPVPLARWSWRRGSWLWRHRGARAVWIGVLFLAFLLGLFGLWPYTLVFVAVGVGLAALAWRDPRGLGPRVTGFWAACRLPGVRSGATGRRPATILAAALGIGPLALGGAGAALSGQLVAGTSAVTVSGDVVVAGPLAGARVDIHALTANGQPGALLATATTDAQGRYVATVSRHGQTLLVTTSGGTYVDEITHRRVSAGRRGSLQSVLTPTRTSASPNPLSTAATVRARVLASEVRPLPTSVAVAFVTVARQFDVVSVSDLVPAIADIPPAEQAVVPTYADRQLGLILGGLDEEADRLRVTDIALGDAIATDLSDGTLNGKDGAAPVMVNPTTPLPADATTGALQAGINSFAASAANLTGDPAPRIDPKPSQIYLNLGIPVVVAPSAPNFVDGQAGAVDIVADYGRPPYHCRLTAGDLPASVTLSGCTLRYDGAAVLGPGTTKLISFPFTITVTDSAAPAKSSALTDLRVTFLPAPPVIHVHSASCPAGPASCGHPVVATASGGVPFFGGYTFEEDIPGGLPFGLRVETYNSRIGHGFTHGHFGDLDGDQAVLANVTSRSSPDQPLGGHYPFRVCVVDWIGAEACGDTYVDVSYPRYTPSPAPPGATKNPQPEQTTQPSQQTLPPGFPADLPSGTYTIEICQAGVPGYTSSSCVQASSIPVSAGDEAQLADALQQLAGTIDQQNGYGGTIKYTPWNGRSFSLEVLDHGEVVVTLVITKTS